MREQQDEHISAGAFSCLKTTTVRSLNQGFIVSCNKSGGRVCFLGLPGDSTALSERRGLLHLPTLPVHIAIRYLPQIQTLWTNDTQQRKEMFSFCSIHQRGKSFPIDFSLVFHGPELYHLPSLNQFLAAGDNGRHSIWDCWGLPVRGWHFPRALKSGV